MAELWMSWTEAWLVVATATAIYFAMLLLSRVFGQRQFATLTTYDFPFVFAVGSLIGRVILVRTSLAAALLGLVVMFVLHMATGWLHHNVEAFHRASQNPPRLLAVDGRLLPDGLRAAHSSAQEVYEAVRQHGLGSLEDTFAVVLERNGTISVIPRGKEVQREVWQEVEGAEHVLDVV